MSLKTRGIIYYTDERVDEPIKTWVENRIYSAGLPIVKATPATVGETERCYPTMIRQIIYCLDNLTADYAFFCESDVLYPESHFDFVPEKDDIFYYNENVWRWDYPKDRYFTYDRLISLSGMCANRRFALEHYKKRLWFIQSHGYDHHHKGEPSWLRKMGYEPGTKKIKRGGFSDDDFETWRSERPIIDIRHNKTFSPRKVTLKDFKHKPTGWKETNERP